MNSEQIKTFSHQASQVMMIIELAQVIGPYVKDLIEYIDDNTDFEGTMVHIKAHVGESWDLIKSPAVQLYNLIHHTDHDDKNVQ